MAGPDQRGGGGFAAPGTGAVLLRSGELSPDIGDAASLPGKDYHLGAITLRNCSAPSDADLQTIGKAVHLRELDLSGTKMSDKGAEYLAELKSLASSACRPPKSPTWDWSRSRG